MNHSEFALGLEFWMSGAKWRCTDVGTRCVVAIKLDQPDESWYKGPPYAVVESVIDEYDLPACSLDDKAGQLSASERDSAEGQGASHAEALHQLHQHVERLAGRHPKRI